MQQKDAKIKYADIIRLPHHQSATRAHMSLYDRAAQFAPFAALTGYDEMIAEEGRLTESERSIPEYEKDILDRQIQLLQAALHEGEHPFAALTCFIPDERKSGGRYDVTAGYVKKVDATAKKIILYGSENIEDKTVQPIEIPTKKVINIRLNPDVSDIDE